VHAVPDEYFRYPYVEPRADQRAEVEAWARQRLGEASVGNLPAEALQAVEIWFGQPARVLARVAHEAAAELVVAGAKHRTRLGQWLAGSTPRQLTRLLHVPLLVATASAARIRRVLVATDLTGMVSHTIAAGERLARLCGAEVRVVHVVPTHPLAGEPRADTAGERLRQVEEALERGVWPLVTHPGATKAVLHGPIRHALAEEAAEWEADVLVVGSHSLPPVDRLLLGSVSDALLRELPTSVLVVPYPR
jgi:nucleotide-binding universal stress UspA family protein